MPYLPQADTGLIKPYFQTLETWLAATSAGVYAAREGANPVVFDQIRRDGVIATSGNHVTSATAAFVAGDVGKRIWISGGRTISGGYWVHHTTIATVVSATQATLTVAPTQAVAGNATFGWGDGTGNAAKLQALVDAAALAGGGIVSLGAGTLELDAQLVLKNRVYLVGAGFKSTVLRAKPSLNVPLVINYAGSSGASPPIPAAMFCGGANLSIDGNAQNQAGTVTHGVYFNTDPLLTQNQADEEFDTHQFLTNVYIFNCDGDGFRGRGRGSTDLLRVHAYYCNGVGFNPGFDSTLTACVAGSSGQQGFLIASTEASIRLIGCVSFYSGRVTAGNGHGFDIQNAQGSTLLANCLAQDNKANGFVTQVNAARVTATACAADSNSTSTAGAYVGFDFWQATDNIFESCVSMDRTSAGNQTQWNMVRFRQSSVRNRFSGQHSFVNGQGALTNAQIAPILDGGGSDSQVGNDIRINGQLGAQAIAWGSTLTINPYLGGYVKFGLMTSTATIAAPTYAHPGCRLMLEFIQDATANSHTITWNPVFKGGIQPTFVSGKVSSVEFIFDGTSWVQFGSTVNM